VAQAAEDAGLPVIIQISENAVRFHSGRVEPIVLAARGHRPGGRAPRWPCTWTT
jgi:fructose-bisphosphate aldolase class II